MSNFGEGHPCAGKDCKDCETCIFDEDLFLEKNKKIENKMNNTRLCDGCDNLLRNYEDYGNGHFDAACKAVSYEAFGQTRPRRISCNLCPNQEISSPGWCPKLLLPSQVTHKPTPQQTGPGLTQTHSTYYDRREKMKGLRKHIEWKDIKEGEIYLIPKILTQSRKIVKVITKTDMCCTCREISEYTGNEYTYNSTFYPSDLDTVFITKLLKF